MTAGTVVNVVGASAVIAVEGCSVFESCVTDAVDVSELAVLVSWPVVGEDVCSDICPGVVACVEGTVGAAVPLSGGNAGVAVGELLMSFFTVCAAVGVAASPTDVTALASVVGGGSVAAATPAVPSASSSSSSSVTTVSKVGW